MNARRCYREDVLVRRDGSATVYRMECDCGDGWITIHTLSPMHSTAKLNSLQIDQSYCYTVENMPVARAEARRAEQERIDGHMAELVARAEAERRERIERDARERAEIESW